MRAPLTATLICLCAAASAVTCGAASPPAPSHAAQPPEGAVMAAMALPAPACVTPATADTGEPRRDGRGMLLAGLALMAAIALRRTGGPR